MKRTLTALLMAAPIAVSVVGAPVAAADDGPPPIFNIPVEILPYIVVPPEIAQYAAPLGGGARDLILDNPSIVQGGAGILGNISCAIANLFGRPCP